MANLNLIWNQATLSADLTAAEKLGLRTAVVISLGTDRLAAADDPLPVNNGDRRGYWGDIFTPGRNLGSRLWLLARAKNTEETRQLAIKYAQEALSWMIQDQICQQIAVTARWVRRDALALSISIARQSAGGGAVNHTFDLIWSTEMGLAA